MSTAAYPNPQAIFYQQYEAVRRDEVVGILLALFLGTFGVHHFRVREFNAIQAAGIAAALGIPMPGWGQPVNVTVNMPGAAGAAATQPATQGGTLLACGRCKQTNPPGARFCAGCGGAL
jgi:hypothetical protein